MNMNSPTLRTVALMIGLALPGLALAHSGADLGGHHHAMGFMDGLTHPLTGLDHLAAMLAVGIWSALTARRLWLAPLAFALMLLAGALIGLSGFTLPAVEPMIASSLLVLGLLVALRKQLPPLAAVALVGGFAVFHGLAHGVELAASEAVWMPLAGMLQATVALHVCGLLLGLTLRAQSPWWPRVAGVTVSLLGGVLLLHMV